MVRSCVVGGCTNKNVVQTPNWEDWVSFITFPDKDKEPERHQAWCRFVLLNCPSFRAGKKSVICSQHFRYEEFENMATVTNQVKAGLTPAP